MRKVIPLEQEFLSLSHRAFQLAVVSFKTETFSGAKYKAVMYIYSPELKLSNEYSVYRRYQEYLALYKKYTAKYPKEKLPEFPSKIQLINKEESRLKYFDSFLKTLYERAKMNEECKSNIYKMLYDFYFPANTKIDYTIEPLSELKLSKFFKVVIKKKSEEIEPHEKLNKSVDTSSRTESFHEKRSSSFKDKITLNEPIESINQIVNENEKPVFTSDENEWSNVTVETNYQCYKQAYMKIIKNCLFIYKTASSTNFNLMIPLYKLNVDVYRIILPKTATNKKSFRIKKYISAEELFELNKEYPQYIFDVLDSEIEINLYFNLSNFYALIKFPSSTTINTVSKFIKTIDNNSYIIKETDTPYINQMNISNYYMYGCLYIDLLTMEICNFEGQCYIKLTLEPYSFQTKKMLNASTFEINQSFIFPLHNRFASLNISVYRVNENDGILKKVNEEKLGEYSIEILELLNNYKIENEKIIFINKDIALLFKYDDCSSMLALGAPNKNKRIIEDISFNNPSDENLFTIGTILKRIKRVLLLFRYFDQLYDSIFQFKYPIFSSILMILEIVYLFSCQTNYILSHIIIFFAFLLFVNSQLYKATLSDRVDKLIFSVKNPYDLSSEFVSTIDENEEAEIQQSNYLLPEEKSGFSLPSLDIIRKARKTYKELLFLLTKILTSIEKMKNLFLWTDPLLSLYFFITIIVVFLVTFNIQLRFLLMLSFTVKFLKGTMYYKTKYFNNMAIASLILKYCYSLYLKEQKNFEDKINEYDLKKIKVIDDKLQSIIIKGFIENAEVVIKKDIFNNIKCLDDLKNEVAKCKELIRLLKTSNLLIYTKYDKNIFIKPIEPEEVFYYFAQNVKSDYYLAKHTVFESDYLKDFEDVDMSEFDMGKDHKNSHDFND